MVDQWLEAQGLERKVVYTTPNYLQAAHIVASSDLAAVLPTQLARYFATLLPLQTFDLPFDLGTFALDIVSLPQRDRKSVVKGQSVQVRVDLGGRRLIKKKNRN